MTRATDVDIDHPDTQQSSSSALGLSRLSPPSTRSSRGVRFAALSSRNYRLNLVGQAVATTGLWVARIAQDWLVLSLTGSATAVGVTTALQWAPMLVFGMAGGWIADRYPRRRVLMVCQVAAAAVAGTLAVLTLTGEVAAWHVQLLAACLGTIAAVEKPVRAAFVAELVEPHQLRSAISLNYSVFYLGNFAGPAISGVLITAVGPGWAFAANALAYTAPLITLACITMPATPSSPRAGRASAATSESFSPPPATLWAQLRRPGIWQPIVIGAAFCLFSLNLPVILTSTARDADMGPAGYAAMTSALALGSVVGGLISAGRKRSTITGLLLNGFTLAGVFFIAAAMPTPWTLIGVLAIVGAASTLLMTATNTAVQLGADTAVRGRVMGVYMLAETGTAAIGGPVLGLVIEHHDPRTALTLAAITPTIALLALTLIHIAPRARKFRARGGHHASTRDT